MTLPVRTALRYVQPLREGGSLPALIETDGGSYVVKFRGAGQGPKALVAEVIVGEVARALGLPVPEIAVVHLADAFGRAEPDPEVQDILHGSRGENVGLAFVRGAFAYDPVAHADLVAPETAAATVWLDALALNIDRTARNPNLLVARGDDGPALWLIDHGAALYVHHDWESVSEARAQAPFPPIRDHVLLPVAAPVADLDDALAARLAPAVIADVLAAVPDSLLVAAPPGRTPDFETPDQARAAYAQFLDTRLAPPRRWAREAARAQAEAPDTTPLPYRR